MGTDAPTPEGYSIAVFAYNEQNTIGATLNSIIANSDHNLRHICVLANGCIDKTAATAEAILSTQAKVNYEVVEIELGDKCNTWNTFVYEYLPNTAIHFFVDSDVTFTKNAFPILFNQLQTKPDKNAVTGLPQSGRNIEHYTELVVKYSCLFGNIYALTHDFLVRLSAQQIKLPVGLCWIDAQITKLVNEDLRPNKDDYKGRVTYVEGTGYIFDSLKPWNKGDRKIYLNRITRYKAGQLQEPILDTLPFTEWPDTMKSINEKIVSEPIGYGELGWKVIFKKRIMRRLKRIY